MPVTECRFLPETLLLDLPEIDREHESIFQLLATFKACCLERNAQAPKLAQDILAEVRRHFRTEERLANEAGVNFSSHAREHDKLLKILARLLEFAHQGGSDVFAVLRYVDYWCERHINEEDKFLGQGAFLLQPETDPLLHMDGAAQPF